MKLPFPILTLLAVTSIVILAGCKTSTETQTPLTVKQGITGTVTASDTHSPISGVTVTLSAPAAKQTTTNSQGGYLFDNVPVGDYTVSFSKSGYGDQSQTVHVDSGTNNILNVSLISASSAGIVSFHVIDARTGLPIPGVLVNCYVNRDSLVTDAQGNVQFAFTSYSSPAGFTFRKQNYSSELKPDVSIGVGFPVHDTISMVRFTDYLVCDYRFAGNFLDSSGNGHNATQHGTKFVTDRFGTASGALQFNGTTDYVSVADAADLNFGKTTDFTIGVWLNNPSTQASANAYVINKSPTNPNPFFGYQLIFETSNGVYTRSTAGTTYGSLYTRHFHIGGDNLWHFCCVVFKRSGKITVYFDGVLVEEVADPNGYLKGDIKTAADLVIGGTGSALNAYKGMLDDVKIYGVGLDIDAVNQVYHENGW